MKKLLAFLLLVFALPALGQSASDCVAQAKVFIGKTAQNVPTGCINTQSTTISGTALTVKNSVFSLIPSFGEVFSGSPASVSVVIQGCKYGPTGAPAVGDLCATLDTNTSANTTRAPTLTVLYDYFIVTPTFSGGTTPTATINTTLAKNGGSSSGGGGGGTLTGITTGASSGLIGGGSSGTLNLSLLTTCSTNQVLQWSGSAWACATVSGGGAFQVDGTPLTSTSTINFQDSAATNGLTLSFSNPSLGNIKLGLSGTLTNAGLTNSSATVQGQTCTLGAACNINSVTTAHGVALNEGAATQLGGTAVGATNTVLLGNTGADPSFGSVPNAALANSSVTLNGQTVALGASGTIPIQTNGTGNTSQAGINLITSTANSVGLTVTPTNSATNQEKFEVTGGSYTGNAATATNATEVGGITITGTPSVGYVPTATSSSAATWQAASSGFSNPMTTLGDVIYENATPAPARLAGPTSPNGVAWIFSSTPSGGVAAAPVWSLAGVPIDATNPATLLVTDRTSLLDWTSGNALALPSIASSGFGNNFPFPIRNTSSSTLTITPNAGHSDLCDGAATCSILNNFSAFVYQDAATNWKRIYFPTFAAFGSTCTGVLQWSTTSGFSCTSVPTLTGTNFTGIPNAGLTNSSITIAGTSVSLGGSTSSLPSPGAIGGTTPAAITGTTIVANTSLVINGGTAQTGTQGTDTKLMTAGTVSGTGAALCTDASGGATTTGCPAGGGDTITSPNSTLNVGGTSTATTLDLAGAAGEIMAGATPALTATPTLGASGTLGSLTFGNATSGLLTIEPVTGALGTVTASFPANTGTVAETNLAQTFSANTTFSNTLTVSKSGASGVPGINISGTPFAGSGTTSIPLVAVSPTGTTAVSTWSTGGTYLGFNAQSGFTGNFIDSHVAGGNPLFTVGPSGSVLAAGTISGEASTQNLTVTGGLDASANSVLGNLVLRGANETGTGGSTSAGGGALIEGGSNAATNAASQAGSVELLGSASTGSTQGLQGLLIEATTFVKGGGTSTQWNLQCLVTTTAMTVNDCPATPSNVLGIAELVNTNTVQTMVEGQAPINASAAVTVGHTVCAGSTAGKVTDSGSTSGCPNASGATVGVVLATAGTWTLPDGTSFTATTTLPLVSLSSPLDLNTGTVTSVAQTVPTGFAIGGSPITTSGTLAITTTGLTTNVLQKAVSGGIGNSSITDNGTTISSAEDIALGTTNCITFGSAGGFCATEGTAPTNVASTAALYPDSTAHELEVATNGSTSFGILVRAQPGSIDKTAQTAAVSTATLCAASAGACNVAGQYHVHWNFWGSGTACSSVTAGSVTFLLTWTDEQGTTHSAVALNMMAQTGAATTAMQATFPFQTSLANESAGGDLTISTNGSVIQYATGYTACTTGTGTYNLRATVTRIQ